MKFIVFKEYTIWYTTSRGINFSAYDLPAPPEIAFDNKNDSMIAFTVEVKSLKMAETLKGLPKIKFNNNTIITFGK